MSIFHIWLIFPFLISTSNCFILYLIYSTSYSWLHYAGLISSRLGSSFLSHIFRQMKCRKTERIMQKYPMNKHFFCAFTNSSPSNLLFQTFFLGFVGLVFFSSFAVLKVQVFVKLSPFWCLISFGCILLFVSPTLLQNKLVIWFPPTFLIRKLLSIFS